MHLFCILYSDLQFINNLTLSVCLKRAFVSNHRGQMYEIPKMNYMNNYMDDYMFMIIT